MTEGRRRVDKRVSERGRFEAKGERGETLKSHHSIPLALWSHPKSPSRQWQNDSPSLNILNRQNLIAWSQPMEEQHM